MQNTFTCLIAIAFVFMSQIRLTSGADAEWDRSVLPRPLQQFEGVAKRTLEGSVASFTQPVKAPAGAPNILLVLIDDAGFGNASTFGGPVATPTFDKLAVVEIVLDQVVRNREQDSGFRTGVRRNPVIRVCGGV